VRVILTVLHAIIAVETITVVVIDATDVHTHKNNLILVAVGAFNCFIFLKPSVLLIYIRHFFIVIIEPEHVEIVKEWEF
jgi:hypothetical protein